MNNDKIMKFNETAKAFWSNRSKGQKGLIIGSSLAVIALIVVISLFATKSDYVPLYKNLSIQEVGQIKAELDARAVPYEIGEGGSTISVPKEQADSLLVDLAGLGIPNSGSIDYSFFSENTSWGITDNEFNVMHLDAMQTELANLIKSIQGINDATVMINMPKEPIFVNEATQPTSASIVIQTAPGHRFEGNQITALYQLVSKAVPNLNPENITIMNQYSEHYDMNTDTSNGFQDVYSYQQTVKRDIERDIQGRLQQMLGTMVGMDNVIVSVTADVDFTQENRVEEIVEPADQDNMEGLPVSVETIHETYTGSGANQVGGTAGAGEGDIPGYEGADNGDDGEYEYIKETVNNEFNRIQKEIVESPYKVRDLGIQVAVDRMDNEGNRLNATQEEEVRNSIADILNSIITTSVDPGYQPNEAIEDQNNTRTSIVFQEFSPSDTTTLEPGFRAPLWMYIVGGVLLLVIVILIILLLKRRSKTEEAREEAIAADSVETVPDLETTEETESIQRKKQLEKMAKDRPEEFAKLLRGWLGED
ncbi:flagellar basal-body MS-ring/collar protein FliF [Ornithinibacillus sp. 179-J 7C1 HS]|uniref:flagellar basal-body MS-ring/collar protein FliF n=1 Tax=Ornithinibacillus sp. 179-J 7C1 HS TaxID=3142384 RepID=UPI00399FA423